MEYVRSRKEYDDMLEIAQETNIFFKHLNMKLIIILIRNH